MTTALTELQRRVDEAAEGAVVAVPAGRYEGNLVISHAMTLQGAGSDETILDAGGSGTVLTVEAADADVRVEGVRLENGAGRFGGGLYLANAPRVTLTDAVVANCSSAGRGGGIALEDGELNLERVTITGCSALVGGALYLGGIGEVQACGCSLATNRAHRGGAIACTDGASLRLGDSALTGNDALEHGHALLAHGSSSRAPRVELQNVRYTPPTRDGAAIHNDPTRPAEITLADCDDALTPT
jgi:hypothetical protein